MIATYKQYQLQFKQAAGTSRGTLREKETWYLYLENEDYTSVGECNLFRGLSCDDVQNYEACLSKLCDQINSQNTISWSELYDEWKEYPSLMFGLETALKTAKDGILYPSEFTRGREGIPINGLIWMGSIHYMQKQIEEKLRCGYKVLKLKIGALNWNEELKLLTALRNRFPEELLEIRVDANGAFEADKAMRYLDRLAKLKIHSIEQPIKSGQREALSELCKNTPLPIALDEELIGIHLKEKREELLTHIKPQYIILKPALVGGFESSQEWIALAENQNVGWWITSALESNVGLSAIAQWTFTLNSTLPQGLGTGTLYTNNTPSSLQIINNQLWYKS